MLDQGVELLAAARVHMQRGELQKTLELLDEVEHFVEIGNPEAHLAAVLLRSKVLIQGGEFDVAFMLAGQAVDEGLESGEILGMIEGLAIQAEALLMQGKHEEALESIEAGEFALAGIYWKGSLSVNGCKADLLHLRAMYHKVNGELDLALANASVALSVRERLDDKFEMASTLNMLGLIYEAKGDLQIALDYQKMCLRLGEHLGNNYHIARAHNSMGAIFHAQGELIDALECHQRSLEIEKEIPGGKYDKALTLHSLGLVHQKLGDHDAAMQHLREALAIREQVGNELDITQSLLDITILAVEQEDMELAKQCVKRIQAINKHHDNRLINQRTRVAEGMILKQSPRTSNQAKAQALFQEIVDEDAVQYDLTVFAMLNLFELLLLELRATAEEEVLEDIKEISARLHKIASKQRSCLILLQTRLLQAKLALLELDLKRAEGLLAQAEITAVEKGLGHLSRRVKEEGSALFAQMDAWDSLVQRKASLVERMELARIEDLIARMVRRHAQAADILNEEPVLMLIMTQEGLTVFSRHFVESSGFDDQIIGGFLSAFALFSREALPTTGTVEQISYEDCTMILKFKEPLTFCYMFRKDSIVALSKLNRAIDALYSRKDLWDTLSTAKHRPSNVPRAEITDIIDRALLSSE